MSSATSRPCSPATRTKRLKSSSVPRSGLTLLWPPSSEPMAHGLPGSAAVARDVVVASLAVRAADRVDGRQVQDVEAHPGDVGEPLLDIAEGAVRARLAGRAREQLVPGAEARPLEIDQHLELARVAARQAAIGVALHERLELFALRRRHRSPLFPECLGQRGQLRGVVARGAPGRGLHQARADLKVELHVLRRFDALGELPVPRPERVDPALDRVDVPPDLGRGEASAPAVVDQRCHRRLGPLLRRLVPVPQHRRQRVVAVGEHVGLDHDDFAHRALGRKPARVDLGRDRFDGDAPAGARGIGRRCVWCWGGGGSRPSPCWCAGHSPIVARCDWVVGCGRGA